MKSKVIILLVLIMCVFSTPYNAQTSYKMLTSDNYIQGINIEQFKNTNLLLKDTELTTTVEVNGIESDDYNKIIYVIFDDKIMNCVIVFNDTQNIEALSIKYGEPSKTSIGYEWCYNECKVKIFFNYSIPKEVMVLFNVNAL